MGQESEETRRYRVLAARARQSAGRATDPKIKDAYEDIAKQYDALAASVERIARRDHGQS